MRNAVIVDALRSPMAKGRANIPGRPGGAFATLHPVELLGQVFAGLFERNNLDAGLVDDVIVGCVNQVGEQSATPGRWAWLAAGLPEHVPAVTIDRRCGSSQQAADFAAQGVMAGAYDIVVAGGVESMSRIPIGSNRGTSDPFGPSVHDRYDHGLVSQGISSELIAAEFGLTRDELDRFAEASHANSAGAVARGDFDNEIIPINVLGTSSVISADETIRPDTSVETLSALRPAFYDPSIASRMPHLPWSTTAGNSSQLADGASALLIMEESIALKMGLVPRARFHSFAVVSDDPIRMLAGPISATEKVLKRAGLDLHDIDHFEVNEAFASVPLAWMRHFGVDPGKVNPRGGAIALGHPLGASGTRLMTTMLNALESSQGRFGLQTMCEAGGMANATIIERMD